MAQLRPDCLGSLRAAMAREADAASDLATAVGKARGAMEALDTELLAASMAEAVRHAEKVSQAGRTCAGLTELAARAAGLDPGAALVDVAQALGPDLLGHAKALSASLEGLAREVAAVGISARYAAGLWSHLIGLRGTASPSYGPGGRPSLDRATHSCRA